MPAQTDRQKRIPKNVIFVFSALNYRLHVGIIYLRNLKLQEIFDLQIYTYKD